MSVNSIGNPPQVGTATEDLCPAENGQSPRHFAGGLVGAALCVSAACGGGDGPPPVPEISQPTLGRVGLADSERSEFYHLDEGSEVFPLAWFLALESETGSGLFTDNLERFGLLPDAAGASNPFGLPVGLTAADTRDLRQSGVRMVGVNCAACHVSEVIVNGKRTRLDGAGGRADISKFYGGLAKATVATATSPQKFLAFLKRVREPEPSTVLSQRESDRAEAGFEALAELSRRESTSPFDKALENEILEALEEEMKRPAPSLPPTLILKPGSAQESAARALRSEVAGDLSDAALRKHLPRAESSAVILGGKIPQAEDGRVDPGDAARGGHQASPL